MSFDTRTSSALSLNAPQTSETSRSLCGALIESSGFIAGQDSKDQLKIEKEQIRQNNERVISKIGGMLNTSAVSDTSDSETTTTTTTSTTTSRRKNNLKINYINFQRFCDLTRASLVEVKKTKEMPSSITIGPTGSGKSTFISYMNGCNFLLQRGLLASFLVPLGEEIAVSSGETASCTSEIKTHQVTFNLDDKKFSHALTDCPGFLDTREKAREMALSIAFCDLFNSSKKINSIIVVLDAGHFQDPRFERFRDTAAILCAMISNFNKIEKSVFFILTKGESTTNKAYSNKALLCKIIKGLLAKEKTLPDANEPILKILGLIKEENLILADFTKDNTRNEFAEKIKAVPSLSEDAIQYKLKGDRRVDIESFIDKSFESILRIRKQQKHLKKCKVILQGFISSIKRVQEIAKQSHQNKELEEFKEVKYSEQLDIKNMYQKEINFHKARINRLDAGVKLCERGIEKAQNRNVASRNGDRIKCLTALEQAFRKQQELLNEKDRPDLVEFWKQTLEEKQKKASFFEGFESLFGCEVSEKAFSFNYSGKPYVKFISRPDYKTNKRVKQKLRILKDQPVVKGEPDKGVFEAIYQTDIEDEIPFEMMILGEKRVKYQEEIEVIKRNQQQISERIALQKQRISFFETSKDNFNKEKDERSNLIKDIENELSNPKFSDQNKHESVQNKLKKVFDEKKLQSLVFYDKTIAELDKVLSNANSKFSTSYTDLERLERKIKDSPLHDPENIQLLTKVCHLTGIQLTSLKKIEKTGRLELIPDKYKCVLSNDILISPQLHKPADNKKEVCSARFEKTFVLDKLQKSPLLCPTCKETLTKEHLEEDKVLKAAVLKYMNKLLASK